MSNEGNIPIDNERVLPDNFPFLFSMYDIIDNSDDEDRRERKIPLPSPTSQIPSSVVRIDCIVCRENMIDTITSPCQHAVMCVRCARNYGETHNHCPMCRTSLDAINKIYISYVIEKKDDNDDKEKNEDKEKDDCTISSKKRKLD